MPYNVRKLGDKKWCVYDEDGKNRGCSESKAMATSHLRALYHAHSGGEFTKTKK